MWELFQIRLGISSYVLDELTLVTVKGSKDVHTKNHKLFQCVEVVKTGKSIKR